jgi:hypothetical protein
LPVAILRLTSLGGALLSRRLLGRLRLRSGGRLLRPLRPPVAPWLIDAAFKTTFICPPRKILLLRLCGNRNGGHGHQEKR